MRLVPLLALFAAASPSPAIAGALPDAIVARVDGEPVAAREVATRARADDATPTAALDAVVQEVVLARAARASGVAARPDVAAQLAAARHRIAVTHLIDEEILRGVTVTRADVEAAFHARADQVRLSMVTRDRREEAAEVLVRLRTGESLLDEAKKSPDPEVASRSGVLGWFARGDLAPELARVAFSAPLLTPAGPVALPKGFAVVVVHERKIGTDEAFAAQERTIAEQVVDAKRQQALARWLASLRARRHARVDDAFLAETGERAEPTAVERQHVVATADGIVLRYADVAGPLLDAARKAGSSTASIDMKRRLTMELLDRRLLEREAVVRGMERRPAFRRELTVAERRVLAAAYAREVGPERAAELRRAADVVVHTDVLDALTASR
jgi:hypothetical protein